MHTSEKDISMNERTWFHFPHTLLFKNSSSIQLSYSSATNLRKELRQCDSMLSQLHTKTAPSFNRKE